MPTQAHEFVTVEAVRIAMRDKLFAALGVAKGTPDLDQNETLRDALEYANETVADSLRERYTLPLERIPASLRGHAVALVAYKLMAHNQPQLAETYRAMNDDATDYLRRVRDGEIALTYSPENRTASNVGLPQRTDLGGGTATASATTGNLVNQTYFSNF